MQTHLDHCPDALGVGGFVASIASPLTANSNNQGVNCEAGAPAYDGIYQHCLPDDAGVPGDGLVTFQYDFGGFNYGAVGCPLINNEQGGNAIAALVVADDGSSALIRIGFDGALDGYSVDYAFPYDVAAGTFGQISCRPASEQSVRFDQVAHTGSGVEIDLTLQVPFLESDCTAGSAGDVTGTCPRGPSSLPVVTRGRLFTLEAHCGGTGNVPLSGWSLAAVQPDGSGAAHLSLPEPAPDNCLYVGATYNLDGLELPAVAGYQSIASCSGGSCDPFLEVPDRAYVQWHAENSPANSSLYRGDLKLLQQTGALVQDPATVPLAARWCGTTVSYMNDPVTLAPGQGVFYFVPASGSASIGCP